MFFREKHLFMSSWFSSLSPLFLEKEAGEKSCQVSIVKKIFCSVFQYVFHGKNSPFSSFHFFVIFLSFFLLRSRRSDGRWQNTSSREGSEGSGENGHKDLTRESFVGVFLSMTEGRSWWTRVNQGDCVRRLDILGKGSAMVCFLWLTDLSVTQTASGTPASESLSSCSQTSNVRRRSWTKRIKWSVSKTK